MRTHVAQLTPMGRGAIASLVVDGPLAVHAVAAYFRPHGRLDPMRLPIGRIVTGHWHSPPRGESSREDAPGEELVACRIGDQRLEVHCHGGQAAIAAIIHDLQQQGCVEASWDEFPLNSDLSRLQRAAQHALAMATTERTALILLDQYHGALTEVLREVAADLMGSRTPKARQHIVQLLQHAAVGLHLTEPWRVVLAGPPNVGKSSLINALVGFQRTVVFGTPGTTRDVVTVPTAIDGWPVELSDTAGLRATTDPLESAGVRRARQALQQADLVLWVQDATEPLDEPSRLGRSGRSHLLTVLNKCDRLAPAESIATPDPPLTGDGRTVLTSAITGEGLPELLSAIGRRLVPEAPPAGAAVPFCEDHVKQLRDILAAIEQDEGAAGTTEWQRWLAHQCSRGS
jgi:tRNA modification GTPase